MQTDNQKMKSRIESRNRMRIKRAEDKMQLEDYVDLDSFQYFIERIWGRT